MESKVPIRREVMNKALWRLRLRRIVMILNDSPLLSVRALPLLSTMTGSMRLIYLNTL